MEKPLIKDSLIRSYVEYIEGKLKIYEESPLVNSYLACLTTINCWNKQLIQTEINIMDSGQKDSFSMGHKYLTEMKPYIEQLEYLRKKMSPENLEELRIKLREENMSVAEIIAVNGRRKS